MIRSILSLLALFSFVGLSVASTADPVDFDEAPTVQLDADPVRFSVDVKVSGVEQIDFLAPAISFRSSDGVPIKASLLEDGVVTDESVFGDAQNEIHSIDLPVDLSSCEESCVFSYEVELALTEADTKATVAVDSTFIIEAKDDSTDPQDLQDLVVITIDL